MRLIKTYRNHELYQHEDGKFSVEIKYQHGVRQVYGPLSSIYAAEAFVDERIESEREVERREIETSPAF